MLATDPAYRGVLHAFAFLHFMVLVVSCHIVGTHELHPLALTGVQD